MNPREYEIMAAVEEEHWWYQSLRQSLTNSLTRFGRALPTAPSILDAGCGTGANLRLLRDRFNATYLGGFDNSPQAVEYSSMKVSGADIYLSDICTPELHHSVYDVVISCDVLYIPGLNAASPGMRCIAERLRPGGLMLLNLPAYNWLRSDHDLAIHTRERFVKSQIRDFLVSLGLIPRQVTYRLCPLFPLVVASRLPSMLRPSHDAATATSALKMPSRLANSLFRSIMEVENRLILAGLSMPFGSSVFAVGQKGPVQ